MTAVRQLTPASIERVGFVGYGYVGAAVGTALADIVEVRHHDPACANSVALSDLVPWADAVFVCVPTPAGANGAADLSAVFAVMSRLAQLSAVVPVILKSTVPPGTCAHIAERWPSLRLLFSPEFLRERHHLQDAKAPHRIVLGWTDSCDARQRDSIRELFHRQNPTVPQVEMSAAEAEMLKYASNALFAIKVSFANEMHELAERLDIAWEPIRRALVLDPRIGDDHLQVPGPDGRPGFGGSCLPKDIAALLAVAADADVELEVVMAALRANARRRSPD